ncbi:MAG: hypothetical protein E5V90_31245, partial [Mesorhizobium sp.]
MSGQLRYRADVQPRARNIAPYGRRRFSDIRRGVRLEVSRVEAEMLQLCLEMPVAQCCGELDIGSPYLAAEQLIDCHADVGVESGQHGKIRLSGAGRSFARAGTAVSEVAQRVDIDALGCQVGEEAMPRPGLKERVHLEALVADLELPALDLIAAIAVELDLAARLQGREFG